MSPIWYFQFCILFLAWPNQIPISFRRTAIFWFEKKTNWFRYQFFMLFIWSSPFNHPFHKWVSADFHWPWISKVLLVFSMETENTNLENIFLISSRALSQSLWPDPSPCNPLDSTSNYRRRWFKSSEMIHIVEKFSMKIY